MSTQKAYSPEFVQALAEALAPLSHNLAAGLLIRPIPPFTPKQNANAAAALYREVEEGLGEHVPAMFKALTDLAHGDMDDIEETVDDLATSALELIDIARNVWECPLQPEAQSLRPILATLAEAPVTQLLQWVLEVLHTAIDPHSLLENPEHLTLDFSLTVPDEPVREAIAEWKQLHPGVL